jgi:hypothetical protein
MAAVLLIPSLAEVNSNTIHALGQISQRSRIKSFEFKMRKMRTLPHNNDSPHFCLRNIFFECTVVEEHQQLASPEFLRRYLKTPTGQYHDLDNPTNGYEAFKIGFWDKFQDRVEEYLSLEDYRRKLQRQADDSTRYGNRIDINSVQFER